MQTAVMRAGSIGIKGTYKNADHHAQNLLPMIRFLEQNLEHRKGCKRIEQWLQGHNVHKFTLRGDRQFVIRPLWKDGESYVGLTLLLRVSRGNEVPLFNIFHDFRNGTSWQLVVDFLVASAKRKDYSSEASLQKAD